MDADRFCDWLIIFLKGLCMGAADTVPGVSGGTIALITGIYERLVTAITELNPALLLYLPKLYDSTRRAQFRQKFSAMDGPFLVVLAAGIGSAVAGLSSIMHRAVTTPLLAAPTFAFFFGLIAASAIVLYRYVTVDSLTRLGVGVVGILIAAGLAGTAAERVATDPSLIVIFLAGAIAIAAMVLPGISGAFILLLLGLYTYMSGIPAGFITTLFAVAGGANPAILVDQGIPLVVFLTGAGIGLVTIAHAVRWALDHYRDATLTFLVALMIGALRAPIERIQETGVDWTPLLIASALGTGLFGVLAVFVLDRFTDDLDYA